ncbi:MAG: hypothetical protein IJF92_01665 [Bacilli bacterium]|nr:hypothetical protein [Bacilli bacterium]
MKIIDIPEKKFKKLTPYEIDDNIINTEAKFYLLDKLGKSYKTENLLLKKIFINEGESMANKLLTVSMLSDNEEKIGIKELVIPKHLVAVKGDVIGVTVPKIDNARNLGLILNDYKVSNEDKIKYLEKVGKLLKKIKVLKKDGIDFSFGDLHEYNFLITENDKLKAIDLDSAYLNSNYPLPSLYLDTNMILKYFKDKYKGKDERNIKPNKYRLNTTGTYGTYYPNENTDILCYDMMILNMISSDKISKLDMQEYFDYINYLEQLGFGEDLIKCFNIVYTNSKNNINPVDFLDQIPMDRLGESSLSVYQLKKKKKII